MVTTPTSKPFTNEAVAIIETGGWTVVEGHDTSDSLPAPRVTVQPVGGVPSLPDASIDDDYSFGFRRIITKAVGETQADAETIADAVRVLMLASNWSVTGWSVDKVELETTGPALTDPDTSPHLHSISDQWRIFATPDP